MAKEGYRGYQLSAKEIALLEREGIAFQELLQYDIPPEEELEKLKVILGYGIVEAILMRDVRKNIFDALAQVVPLTFPFYHPENLEGRIAEAQTRFLNIVELRLKGNPYPGKDFSREQGLGVLELVKSQTWTSQTLGSCLQEIRDAVSPPKPPTKPLEKK